MTILLDTHIIIWLITDPDKVSAVHQSLISNANRRYISAVSFAEVAFKHRKNPVAFPYTTKHLEQALSDLAAVELVLSREHVSCVAQLPQRHKDPFDHLLMAQTISESILFATTDSAILEYQADGLKIA